MPVDEEEIVIHRIGRACLQGIGIGRPGERITHRRDGNFPVRHSAFCILLQSPGKRFLRRVKPERIEQGHAPIEILLRGGATRDGEVNLPELLGWSTSQRVMPTVLRPRSGCGDTQRHHQHPYDSFCNRHHEFALRETNLAFARSVAERFCPTPRRRRLSKKPARLLRRAPVPPG
jgi:hypothetical protein